MDEAERIAAFYRKHGKEPPKSFSHGTEAEIQENLQLLKPNSWRLEGNQLIGETELGPLVQTIPTDRILVGTDDDGLPVFRKVVLS
jgi:hypothetical protein